MKLNTNLPGFYGYYGSIFEDIDTTSEVEYINEKRIENGLQELQDENSINWNYDSYYSELNIVLTTCVEEFLQDLNLVNDIKFLKLHSPKYYNFSNDVIECKIDVKVNGVKKYINENLEAFKNYLIENFKSRSGFVSFYDYDLQIWTEKMRSFKNLDHIEVNAILDFICTNEDFNIVDHLYNCGLHDVPMLNASNFEDLITNEDF